MHLTMLPSTIDKSVGTSCKSELFFDSSGFEFPKPNFGTRFDSIFIL
jgi:hypothetical protein